MTSTQPRFSQNPFIRLFTVLREKSVTHAIVFGLNHVFAWPLALLHRTFNRKAIEYDGKTFECVFRAYNHTWLNERMIELPIAQAYVEKHRRLNHHILEVGNVLSHYFDTEHEIIDKYETAPGVRNIDILDLQTHKRYDLIVCVSTLEHVGWDELPRQPDKLLVAFEHLRSLLADGGILLITAPIGENQFLDECLRDGRLRFDRQHNYLRIGKTRWREGEWNEIKNAQHHHPFRFGNAVVIGEVRG